MTPTRSPRIVQGQPALGYRGSNYRTVQIFRRSKGWDQNAMRENKTHGVDGTVMDYEYVRRDVKTWLAYDVTSICRQAKRMWKVRTLVLVIKPPLRTEVSALLITLCAIYHTQNGRAGSI